MLTQPTPRTILRNHFRELLGCCDGIRDGQPDSVHQARVSTRRLREVLPLFATTHPKETDALDAGLKKVARWLGSVRELDVMRELLNREELRLPSAAPAIAGLRHALLAEQRVARRKMVKRLDAEGLERLSRLNSGRRWAGLRDRLAPSRAWAGTLRQRVAERIAGVREAVSHAAGVYFPNRIHQVRIAVKQLRYSAELADTTGLWRVPKMVHDLRRVQGTLGELHDAQVLVDRLDSLAQVAGTTPADVAAVRGALEAEIDRLHGEYLAARPRLLALCEAGERLSRPHRFRALRPAVVAASAALSTGVLLMSRRLSETNPGYR